MAAHIGFLGDASREGLCDPQCLHTSNHGGPAYTLVKRVVSGFGLSFHCINRIGPDADKICGHPARDHVAGGKTIPCLRCGCTGWVEPPEEETGHRNLEEHRDLGMGPDTPVVTNESGASQSAIPAVFTTMPLRALWELAKLQKYGDDKYGAHNWRGIPESDHIDHAFAHLMADSLGDTSDDHLLHATWRLMAALESRLDHGRKGEGV